MTLRGIVIIPECTIVRNKWQGKKNGKTTHVSEGRKYYILTKPLIWRNICADRIIFYSAFYAGLLLLLMRVTSYFFIIINEHVMWQSTLRSFIAADLFIIPISRTRGSFILSSIKQLDRHYRTSVTCANSRGQFNCEKTWNSGKHVFRKHVYLPQVYLPLSNFAKNNLQRIFLYK